VTIKLAERRSWLIAAMVTPARGARGARAGGADRASRRGAESAPEPWSPLTAREFEVARLVTEGLTNPEVAGELGLSRKTVSAHLEHIMAKLAVGRMAEMAAWVASTGVLHSRSHGEDRDE
jgi:DNA-binding CsgD family transcriptional regulator